MNDMNICICTTYMYVYTHILNICIGRRRGKEMFVPDHEKPGSRCRLSKAHN